MPTYEYNCLKCGKTFELFQSMKDAPLKTCNCGKKGKVKRLVGRGAGIIFKGTGFYETDYKRNSVRTSSEKADSGKGESSKADGGKDTSAPAPAAAPATPSPTPEQKQP
jgi:putative FmdB family regulatory protein